MAADLGTYLRRKRLAAGLSQMYVGKQLGHSNAQFVSNIERGVCLPPLDALKSMMSLYSISSAEITRILCKLQKVFFTQEFAVQSKNSFSAKLAKSR